MEQKKNPKNWQEKLLDAMVDSGEQKKAWKERKMSKSKGKNTLIAASLLIVLMIILFCLLSKA